MAEKANGLDMSLDQYAQESGFYFSSYGDIGLTNQPTKRIEDKRQNRVEESRDIFDLNQGSVGDELEKIIKELETAGTSANNEQDTLNYMIKKGLVNGLPKGTEPEVGLEEQGIALPIRLDAKPGRNNFRNYSVANQRAIRKNGGPLANRLQLAMQQGKMKNANNFDKLPNKIHNGYHHTPNGFNHFGNGYHHNQQSLVRPPQPQFNLNILNSLDVDSVAFRQLMNKNKNGGVVEYLSTVSANMGPKYDLKIQREIAEVQKKCISMPEDGEFNPISFDGPGIDLDFEAKGTRTTLNSRFSSI